MKNQRLELLEAWLENNCDLSNFDLIQIAGDASFRRYYRVIQNDQTWVAMDAPPELEDSHSYVAATQHFHQNKIRVPAIYHQDLKQGFLLLEDLGDTLLLNILNQNNAAQHYQQAFDQLFLIQTCQANPEWNIPKFDHEFITMELDRFKEWYLDKHLNLTLTQTEEKILTHAFKQLIDNATQQPQVCVHRDYHSRNLLLLNDGVGVIDHQDAVWGPITYDLVSLLRDCYITWPDELVDKLIKSYYQQATKNNILQSTSLKQFKRWFDLMGIQRHLKAIGIFARLNHRDNKPNYLNDIPQAMQYVIKITNQYPEFKQLNDLLKKSKLSNER